MLLLFPSMFQQTRHNLSYLVKSLLFIPFDIGGGIIQPLVRIGWTINCEMLFYLLFFIAFHISMKYRGLICSAFLAVLVGAVQICTPVIFSWQSPIGGLLSPVLIFTAILSCWNSFSESSPIIYCVFISQAFGASVSYGCKCAVCDRHSGDFCLLAFFTPRINVIGFRRLPLWGLPALVLLVLAFLVGLKLSLPRFFILMGNISYSLYLVHYYPVMFLDRAVFDFSTLSVMSVIGVILSVALSIGLAYLSWIVVEQKFSGWLRKKLLH